MVLPHDQGVDPAEEVHPGGGVAITSFVGMGLAVAGRGGFKAGHALDPFGKRDNRAQAAAPSSRRVTPGPSGMRRKELLVAD